MERNDTRQEPSDLVLVLHPYAVSVDLHGRERRTGRTTVCYVSLVATCKWLELETRGYLNPQAMMRVHATCNILDIHACVKDGTVREVYTALLEWLEIIVGRLGVKS